MPQLSDGERYVMLKGFVERMGERATKPEDSPNSAWDHGFNAALDLIQSYIGTLGKD